MNTTHAETIGFLGPGAMGAGMVSRLLDAGHRPLVCARDPRRIAGLLERGAEFVGDAAVLAARSDIVLSCLRDSAVVTEVVLSPGGVADALRTGSVLVEHGTISPALAERLDARLRERGAGFLDAPVSGGPEGARSGTLAVMVGGAAADLDRVRGIIESYAGTLAHVGGVGAGQRLKLINQLLVGVHAAAAAEAAALVMRTGIDPAEARRVLGAGWAASTQLDRVLVPAVEQRFDADGAALGGMVEVLRLVAELAADNRVSTPQLHTAREAFAARAVTGGELGFAALITGPLRDAEGTPAQARDAAPRAGSDTNAEADRDTITRMTGDER